jgi:hypothetical protein
MLMIWKHNRSHCSYGASCYIRNTGISHRMESRGKPNSLLSLSFSLSVSCHNTIPVEKEDGHRCKSGRRGLILCGVDRQLEHTVQFTREKLMSLSAIRSGSYGEPWETMASYVHSWTAKMKAGEQISRVSVSLISLVSSLIATCSFFSCLLSLILSFFQLIKWDCKLTS